MPVAEAIVLRSGDATAEVALHGAELKSWRVAGREVIWNADPRYWARSAPILFPVVGASRDGVVAIEGASYPMPQHGFARDSDFNIAERSDNAVTLRLTDSDATRKHYPFSFAFTVTFALDGDTLSVGFAVDNTGSTAMPYQLGWHPAFVWPLLAGGKDGHALIFASEKSRSIVRPDAQGLLKPSSASLTGRLTLTDEIFADGALVFADAASASATLQSPSGASLNIAVENFPHWAVWTKPGAPFVSIEQWTGLPEWEDKKGALAQRPSISLAKPGKRQHHSIRLSLNS